MRCTLFKISRRSGAACLRPVAGGFVALTLMLSPFAVQAQTPVTPVPEQPAKATEVPAVGAAPGADVQPVVPDAQTQAPPLPDLTGVATLVPMPKEPPEVQEVDIPAKPVVILSGQSKWEDNFATLSESFKTINAALEKAGKKPAGRPVVVYTKYTEEGFSYDAMIPLSEAPAADAPALGEGMHYGTTPAGKALRFVHADSYSEVSETYEAAGLYVEMRDLVSKEMQIEEWVTDITDPAARNSVVNLYIALAGKSAGKEPPKNP